MDYGSYILEKRHIPWDKSREHSLGRHVNHDSRSKMYAYKAPAEVTINSVIHHRFIPILDQGNLGSCTGNAIVGARGTHPHVPPTTGPALTQALAVKLYSEATIVDGYPGTYPPDDTGSDGLSVAKAAKNLGLISGYQWTFTLNDALLALQTYPVIIGINWYDSFEFPDSNGLVSISPSASVLGGHEVEVFSVDAANKLVWAAQSWGLPWGIDGTFCFSWDDFDRLLHEQGDVVVPLPLTAPVPVPTPLPVPTPKPSPYDVMFAKQLRVNFIGKLFYKSMQRYAQTWIDKKGL